MINLTEMVSGRTTVSRDVLGKAGEIETRVRPPVVAVWNTTSLCNLKCRHCYANSDLSRKEGELTTEEAKTLINNLKEIGVRILIFSGGEPLLRDDIFDLGRYAVEKGLVALLSTNGTLIDENVAQHVKDAGFKYVGVSIDGVGEKHDVFRGVKGSYRRAIKALQILNGLKVKSGIRFTVTKRNIRDLREIMDLLEDLGIQRICIYHLMYSGRGLNLIDEDLALEQRKRMIEFLLEKALEWRTIGSEIETVGSPVDGVFTYLKLKESNGELAMEAFKYLEKRGGDPSGHRLINIDHLGDVHPNQFWWDYTIGNVKEKGLSEIWFREDDEFLNKLREKHKYVKGKCRRCHFRVVCGGFRVRALRTYGDPWEEDPACYLTEKEIKG